MAITKLNSLAIPAGTVEPADISYPLTNFSSTGIDDNASSNAITIDSSGNIEVSGNFSSTVTGIDGNGDTLTNIGATISATKDGSIVNNVFPADLIFSTNGGSSSVTERMRITYNGNVEVNGGAIYLNEGATGSSSIGIKNGSSVGSQQPSVVFWGEDHPSYAGQVHIVSRSDNTITATAGDISFWDYTGSTWNQNVTIKKDGKVGIGLHNPSSLLHLREAGTGSGEGDLIIATTSDGGNAGLRFRTGTSDRFSITTIGSAGSESLRIRDVNNNAERMRIDASGSAIFNQSIANATAPYASTDSFIQLYNSTAAKTGTLVTADNGNTWLNADGGKTLWLNWASYSSPTSYADIMLGDGNEGDYILRIDGSTGHITTNGNGGTGSSDQAERGSIFVGASFGANISGDNGGGGMFASNVVLNSSNVAKVAFTHTGGYGYAGVLTAWGGINFLGSRASTVTAGDTPQYVAQFLANSGQNSHPEQRYFGTSSRLIERRNFYQTYSTASGQTYWHFKTSIPWGSTSQMYAIHFTGQNYNGSKVIDLNLSFYNYVPSGQPINVGSSSHTNDSATVYESSDGYVVLRYQFVSGNTYYSSIILSQYDTAQGLQTFTVSSSAASSTASYY